MAEEKKEEQKDENKAEETVSSDSNVSPENLTFAGGGGGGCAASINPVSSKMESGKWFAFAWLLLFVIRFKKKGIGT